MIGSGTRKGMRRKGAKKAGLRLAYDGLTKRKRKVSRKTKKMRKSTRKGMRRKGAKRAGLRLAYDGGGGSGNPRWDSFR